MSYFISVDGSRKEGPLSLEAIKLKLLNNEVDESSLLWKKGMSEWRPAGEVAEFVELLDILPPPLPMKKSTGRSLLVPPPERRSEYSEEFSAKLAILEDHRRGIIDISERDELIRKVSDHFSQIQDDQREGLLTSSESHLQDYHGFEDKEIHEQYGMSSDSIEKASDVGVELNQTEADLETYLLRNSDNSVVHGFCMQETHAWVFYSALLPLFPPLLLMVLPMPNVGRYLILTSSGIRVLSLRKGNSRIYKREFLPFQECKVVKSRMGKRSWMIAMKGSNSSYVFSGSYSSKKVKCLSQDELMQVLESLNQ